jgi:aspartate/methionine/tyrosine aminotransferase
MKFAASRTAPIPTTIFTTMSRLAVEHQAVNLGQGFPDFDGPAWIMEEAFKAMKEGKNQYAPMSGTLSLRRAVAGYHRAFYELEWDPETEVTVTAGATEALFSTILALLDPGDEVILFEPFYDSHQANILLAGAVPKYVTLHAPDFAFDPVEIERQITPATTMLILNNPDNPTGKVFTRGELETIAHIASRHDLVVISDEVYEFLTYDDARHIPIATLPDMRERTVTVSSTGKTFGLTGWKIGYAMAAARLTEAIRKVHQFVTFAVNTPGQHAMAHALSKLPEYLPGFRAEYSRKRDLLCAGLRGTVFAPHVPRGSYFVMVDIPPSLGLSDVDCAMKLVRDFGVAAIPPSAFYAASEEGASMLRLCFAKKDETLREGIERLKRVR